MLRCLITVVAFFDYEHKLSHICVVCGGYLAGCAFVTFFHLSFFAYLCTAEHNVFTLLYPRTVSNYFSIETSSQVTHKELNPRACPHVFFLLFFVNPSPHTHHSPCNNTLCLWSEPLQTSIFINPLLSDVHLLLFH